MNINELVLEHLNLLQERLWQPNAQGGYTSSLRGGKPINTSNVKTTQVQNTQNRNLGNVFKAKSKSSFNNQPTTSVQSKTPGLGNIFRAKSKFGN